MQGHLVSHSVDDTQIMGWEITVRDAAATTEPKENVMNRSTEMSKKDQPFEYALSVKDFMQTDVYKSTQKRAMRTSISFMITGILLPLIIGFFTALPDLSKPYFGISVFSNAALALVFTLPLSLGLIWSALPVYHHIIRRLFESYGFVQKVAA